jgi:signal recognition particle subunit SEC65
MKTSTVTDREFRSKPNRTALYEKAVAVLRELLEEKDLDAVERAFAEAAYPRRWEKTEGRVGGKYRDGAGCIERLLGGRCKNIHCENIPGADHTSGYVRDKRIVAIVTEPYHLSFREMRELVQFCDERGLRADVDAESSHFPSRTLRILIRKKDDKEVWMR